MPWSAATTRHHVNFSGDWHEGSPREIDKARAMAHGDFLWFSRDGKSYVVDDPQTLAQIQAMYKPMEDLGRKQEELGRQQEALGRQQEELGRQQEQASIPTPDIAKEMAELNAAIAKLQAKKGGTVTMEQLADLQSKIGELQGKLGELQGRDRRQAGRTGREAGRTRRASRESWANSRAGSAQSRDASRARRRRQGEVDHRREPERRQSAARAVNMTDVQVLSQVQARLKPFNDPEPEGPTPPACREGYS